MDFWQLTNFLHVAELGSVSKAAQRLRIAQPALSRQLRQLEEELEVRLFTRHGRGMVPTAAGEKLRERARDILQRLEETRAELLLTDRAEGGRVVFGMPPSVGGILAARLIERFMAEHPAISLHFVNASSGYLREWLHSGAVDLAVLHADEPDPSLDLAPLLAEDLFFVTAASGPAAPPPIAFEAVLRQRLVLTGQQHGLRILIERQARRHGDPPLVAVEADSLEVLKTLVLKRLGGTILPMAAVAEEVAAGRLQAAPIIQPGLSRRLALALPLGQPVSPACRRFAQVLRQEVVDMVRSQQWSGRLTEGQPVAEAPGGGGAAGATDGSVTPGSAGSVSISWT